MEPKEFTQQAIDFHKAQIDNTFNLVKTIQEQNEKLSKTFIDQLTWLPESERSRINEWAQAWGKIHEDYKKAIDDQLKTIEKVLLGSCGA